jgi:heme-degrading monooxygenase HmoA
MWVSVTRLRIRSIHFLPGFVVMVWRSAKQAIQAPGFLGGALLLDRGFTFWTLTTWKDEESMRQYRSLSPHAAAMPQLVNWCNEAAYAHWTSETEALPGWREAYQQLLSSGHRSKVDHPTANHMASRFPQPRTTISRTLRPNV